MTDLPNDRSEAHSGRACLAGHKAGSADFESLGPDLWGVRFVATATIGRNHRSRQSCCQTE